MRPKLVLRGSCSLDPAQRRERARVLGISARGVELLVRRGIEGEAEQQRFLRPRLGQLTPPTSMAGFGEAFELLQWAIKGQKRIGIFGDYDVDGVTTTTVLASFLEAFGAEVVANVATREGGYGFHTDAAKRLADAGADLVVTGDCGTSDHEALGWLEGRDIPTVVIDHHQVPETMPPARALLNPHQPGCEFPFKGLCSAGVGFYLCASLKTALAKEGRTDLPDPRWWLDLVALGTVCDMVPLVGENRTLVHHGLAVLGHRRRPGLRALLQRAGVSGDELLDESHLGFTLGPRLNAPGRLTTAEPSLSLLRARTSADAQALAAQLEAFNTQRRAHQSNIVEEAIEILQADPRTAERAGIVVADPRWLHGVVGIAANGIVDRYKRPTLVIALDPMGEGEGGSVAEARGSARSFGDVDVRAALAACSHLLNRFGGHKAAAGVSLPRENVPGLVEAFDDAVRAQLGTRAIDDLSEPYDGELSLEEIHPEFLDELRHLGPFGVGFAQPQYVAEDLELVSVRLIREQHVQMRVRQGGVTHEAIAFRRPDLQFEAGQKIGLLFCPQWNTYRGKKQIQLVVDDGWRMDSPDGTLAP